MFTYESCQLTEDTPFKLNGAIAVRETKLLLAEGGANCIFASVCHDFIALSVLIGWSIR